MTHTPPAPAVSDVAVGALPRSVEAYEPLLGTWRGGGHGDFPTIDAFDYGEWMHFEHVGDEFLLSSQRSWLAGDGSPLHFERGFWRPGASDGDVEVTLAHPLGLTEVAEGRLRAEGAATILELRTVSIGRTSTGMDVVGLDRRYRIEGDTLRYEIDMATGSTPMTRHLTGALRRTTD
jgi:hypothetical protein